MASLLGQIAAVIFAALVLRAVLRRAGLTLRLPQATALAALAILAVVAASTYRETWHQLDLQRTQWRTLGPGDAISECSVGLGLDRNFMTWLQARMPDEARYFQPPSPGAGYAPDLCLRMLMLPRVQVEREEDATHVLLWMEFDRKLIGEYRRRGEKVEAYNADRYLVTLR